MVPIAFGSIEEKGNKHMQNFADMTPEQRADYAERVAVLNDGLRIDMANAARGRVVLTEGISAMIENTDACPFWIEQGALLKIVREFEAFTEDNNPHGERDFGAFEWKATRCFWKIDYYDQAIEAGSPDPADPAVTTRVLTILRADEY